MVNVIEAPIDPEPARLVDTDGEPTTRPGGAASIPVEKLVRPSAPASARPSR